MKEEKWFKKKGDIRGTTVNPKFDGTSECDELELSNFSSLDSNIKEKFVVLPSVVSYRVPNRQIRNSVFLPTNKGGRPIGRSAFDANSNKSAPKLDYNFDSASTKSAPKLDYNLDGEEESDENSSKVPESNNISEEKRFLGMSRNKGIMVVSVAALAVGAFVYFKYIKK